ncbi:hypothetical protein, partial [Sodalis sp.]|uniref:hypothetical protein n=1 Tax=Sodalis sp. (in: enterobacteria) TaxID=1898979 RepID=UPI003872A816
QSGLSSLKVIYYSAQLFSVKTEPSCAPLAAAGEGGNGRTPCRGVRRRGMTARRRGGCRRRRE